MQKIKRLRLCRTVPLKLLSRIRLPQKLDELAINNKNITASSLMTTHDPPLLPPHTPPGRGRVMWGVPQVFLLTLIASAGEDNIIISGCSLQSTQLVNNKPGWTEACKGTANPGIILFLLLLFAHYFSSSLVKDNQLNYFHPIVFFQHIGQISSEYWKHLEMILFIFSLPFSQSWPLYSPQGNTYRQCGC